MGAVYGITWIACIYVLCCMLIVSLSAANAIPDKNFYLKVCSFFSLLAGFLIGRNFYIEIISSDYDTWFLILGLYFIFCFSMFLNYSLMLLVCYFYLYKVDAEVLYRFIGFFFLSSLAGLFIGFIFYSLIYFTLGFILGTFVWFLFINKNQTIDFIICIILFGLWVIISMDVSWLFSFAFRFSFFFSILLLISKRHYITNPAFFALTKNAIENCFLLFYKTILDNKELFLYYLIGFYWGIKLNIFLLKNIGIKLTVTHISILGLASSAGTITGVLIGLTFSLVLLCLINFIKYNFISRILSLILGLICGIFFWILVLWSDFVYFLMYFFFGILIGFLFVIIIYFIVNHFKTKWKQ